MIITQLKLINYNHDKNLNNKKKNLSCLENLFLIKKIL